MTIEKYKFLHNIKVDDITPTLVNDFQNGAYGIICVEGADEQTIDKFGKLLDQDMYGRKKVTIGIEDEKGEKLNHATDMLWHQDRAYSDSIHPFVGLYCIRADKGSSQTHYLDMQGVYKDSSDSLKEQAKGVKCVNSITKYMSQEEYPYNFKSKLQERAWRRFNRATHDLVWEDDYGPYYFYSEAYTETELEPQLQKEIYKEQHMYSHNWAPKQLLVYNNHKVLHKRDATPAKVVRQHIRYALDKTTELV